MPTTLGSLLLFVVFLGPGLAFLLTRETRRPRPERSAFREIASLVLSGLLCNILAALVFGLGRWAWPDRTPDVGALIRDPSNYARAHYGELWFAGLTFLMVAVIFAVVFAGINLPDNRVVRFLRGPIAVDSAWELVFNAREVAGFDKYCGCTLDDGMWVMGQLVSSSPDSEETTDRDLVLGPPIKYRQGSGRVVSSDAGRAVISARRLKLLEVFYYEAGADPFHGPTGRPRGESERDHAPQDPGDGC